MNQKNAFTGLGILAYLVFLIMTIPASQGIHWLQELFPQGEIKIGQPEGTIWSGSTYQITAHQTQFHNVSWKVHPLALLTGKIKLSISINDQSNKANAIIGFNTQGLVYIENLNGDLQANLLSGLPYVRNTPPTGSLTLAIESINFSDTYLPTEAEGEIIWNNAGISSPFSISIGTLLITLESKEKEIQAHIRDKKAQLIIDTTIVLWNDGNYKIVGKLTPKPDTDQNLLSTLSFLGKKDSQGIIHVDYTGML